MAKENSPKTSFFQKSVLIIFGVLISIFVVEIFLRIGGFIVLSVQEYSNRSSIKKDGAYRIMCLGESTTAMGGEESYPAQLEKILNEANIGVKFSVINKGIPGIKTSCISETLERDIKDYYPNMVITMMGINDTGYHMAYNKPIQVKELSFLNSLKTYKLARLLLMHIHEKLKELKNFNSSSAFTQNRKSVYEANKTAVSSYSDNESEESGYIRRALDYMSLGKPEDAVLLLKKSLLINPNNTFALGQLATCYKTMGDYFNAEAELRNCIKIKPSEETAYLELGILLNSIGKYPQAEETLREMVLKFPDSDAGYIELSRSYGYQDKYDKSAEVLNKAIRKFPKNHAAWRELLFAYEHLESIGIKKSQEEFEGLLNDGYVNSGIYEVLGHCYMFEGDQQKAEEVLKKSIELDENNLSAYKILAECYKIQNKYDKAQDLLENALNKASGIDKEIIARSLPSIYEKTGKNGSVVLEGTYGDLPLQTRSNYLKVKEILDKSRIQLVCVSYLNRSIKPIKNIFSGVNDIIFVDNEDVLRGEIKKGNGREYFIDMFAGDFGHCTAKGNQVLASNIANTILREYFHQKFK